MKKLPHFVLCVGTENGICQMGRIYSTIEPVGKYATAKFWDNTLRIFPHDFVESDMQSYIMQPDDISDTSFDAIEIPTKLGSVFHHTVKPAAKKKKKKKKKRPKILESVIAFKRSHQVEGDIYPNPRRAIDGWSWDSYNASVNERAAKLANSSENCKTT